VTRVLAALAVLAGGLGAEGCGDNEPGCSVLKWAGGAEGCYDAQILVARDSAHLVPSQAELDRYWRRWRRALAAVPYLDAGFPQRYRGLPGGPAVFTNDPDVIAAWWKREIETGVPAFDATIGQLVPIRIVHSRDQGSGPVSFVLEEDAVFGEEQLDAMLAPYAWLPDAWPYTERNDTYWRWIGAPPHTTGGDDATAELEVRLGNGDCLSGCLWMHRVRVTVPPVGQVEVCDLGGQPWDAQFSVTGTKPAGLTPCPDANGIAAAAR